MYLTYRTVLGSLLLQESLLPSSGPSTHWKTLDTVSRLSGTPSSQWQVTAQDRALPAGVVFSAPDGQAGVLGRHRRLQQQQQQQQQYTQVGLSILTTNPALVVFRLAHVPLDAPAAAASGCRQELCARLAAAGVPVQPLSVQVSPMFDNLLTCQTAPPSAADEQLAANRRLGGIIAGAVAGGVLLLVLLFLRRRLFRWLNGRLTGCCGGKSQQQKQDTADAVMLSRKLAAAGAAASVAKQPAAAERQQQPGVDPRSDGCRTPQNSVH